MTKLELLLVKLAEKKANDDKKVADIKVKYKGKEKVKPLSQAERLDRIEELLGLK